MKKIKVFLFTCLFGGLLTLNLLFTGENIAEQSDITLYDLSIKSAHAVELDPIDIVCSGGSWGACMEEHWLWGIFVCVATGNSYDYCV